MTDTYAVDELQADDSGLCVLYLVSACLLMLYTNNVVASPQTQRGLQCWMCCHDHCVRGARLTDTSIFDLANG